jgi:hypothetical protein
MNRIHCSIAIIFSLAAGMFPEADVFANHDQIVNFDLPAVVEARPAKGDSIDSHQVTIELRLSAIIESPEVPRIDQWLIQCQPRGGAVSIIDYVPRTETASDLASPIQVKQTEESTNAVGLSVDGSYGHLVGNAGADLSKKNINSVQFDRVAPQHAVTASGTINRGRGVYFKLRSTAQQILDGEKTLVITLGVPPAWRGSLIDVEVVAQSRRKSFGWERDSKTIGSAQFVVAVYRQGDREAAAHAEALSDAELTLRHIAAERDASAPNLPSVLRHLALKLDFDPAPAASWVQRLILNQADPRLDDEICELPMPIRIAVLDYVDLRDEFVMINGEARERIQQRLSR